MLSNVQVCYQNAWLLKRCYDKAAEGVQALLSERTYESAGRRGERGRHLDHVSFKLDQIADELADFTVPYLNA